MSYNIREYVQIRNLVFGISLLFWIALLRPVPYASMCCGGDCLTPAQIVLASNPPVSLAFEMVLTSTTPGSLVGDWALMLLAMMMPLLIQPMYHIFIRSFARRRGRSIALFLVGYGLLWMLAGGAILGLTLSGRALAPQSWLPAISVVLVALVWQASPFKQRCLNRCHRHRALAAFGSAADWDALRMGLEHGRWCIGSCWALMLLPMLLPHGHFAAMAAVTILMICERLDPPRTPSWRWRGFGTAFQIIKLKLRGLRQSQATRMYV